MSRTIHIKDIADLNRETFKKGSFPKNFKYLDTGSLTRNRIEQLQEFNSTSDSIPSRAQRRVKKNTILYSTVRPNQEHYGIIEKNFDELVASTGFTTIDVIDENIDSKYLFYYLIQNHLTEYLHTIGMSAVSAYPSISPNDIGELEIKVPELLVQQKIAKVLSDLDAKIELNNKINAELEAMAKLIYDYWFVQFEFPNEEGKPYKSSGGKMVWNEELKREVPEGWEVKALSYWIGKDKSGDWGKEEREGNYSERVFCIRGADLNGLNGKGEVKAPERFILEKNSHKMLDPHDLIVEISGGSPTQSTGRMAYMTTESLERFDAPVICSNFCKAVTLKHEKSLYNFAFEWNKAYDHGVLFGYEGKTSGIKNLLFESFVTSYLTPIPTSELMKKFYDFMTPLESRKQKNLLGNQKLAELRDWLLPMLMNGQVKVK